MNITPTISIVSGIKYNILTSIKLIFLSILLSIVFYDCTAQEQPKITQPQLSLVNDSLIIEYSILNASPDDRFDIRLEITDATGTKINATTLTGDIGDTVTGGINKQIFWNLSADSIFLNTSINVELIAKKIVILETVSPEIELTEATTDETKEEEDLAEIQADEGKKEKEFTEISADEGKEEKELTEASTDEGKKEKESTEISADEGKEEKESTEISADEVRKENISAEEESHTIIEKPVVTSPKVKTGIHILQSAVFPGWGLTKLSNGKPYWLIGVAGTGCIASSIYFNRKAYSNYDNYLESSNREKSNNYYDDAKTQDNISKTLAYTTAAIWVADLVMVGIKAGNMNKSYRKNSLSAFSFGSYIESNTDTPMLSLYINF